MNTLQCSKRIASPPPFPLKENFQNFRSLFTQDRSPMHKKETFYISGNAIFFAFARKTLEEY